MSSACASIPRETPQQPAARISQRLFYGIAALVFSVSAVLAIRCSTSMAMNELPLLGGWPGGWAVSPIWMPMCGQTWLDAATSFIAMWLTMMVAMMLPSLTPVLWRYCHCSAAPDVKSTVQSVLIVTAGYFCVWALLGAIAFPVGASLVSAAVHLPSLTRVVPFLDAIVVLVAGTIQFTSWKTALLAGCHAAPYQFSSHGRSDALRHGLQLGYRCCCCCAGLTATLFVAGVMNGWAMLWVTVAINAERLLYANKSVRQLIGVAMCGWGTFLLMRAAFT